MEIIQLDKTPLSIQKCYLPDGEFIQKNYGRYCFVTVNNCQYIVKISLSEMKVVSDSVFFDNSVSVFSPVKKINKAENSKTILFRDFVLLNSPSAAKSITLTIVFYDILDIKKHTKNTNILKKTLNDILKFYSICENSLVSLINLPKCQTFGISHIVIKKISGSKKSNIYCTESSTEIVIEKCMTQLKFEQTLGISDQVQIGGCSRAFEVIKEMIELSKHEGSHKIKSVKKLLLIGPSGCGKTTLVRKIANDCNCVLLKLSATDINSLTPNDSQTKLMNIFNEAKVYSENGECAVFLIEDVDLMTMGKSSHSKSLSRQLSTLLEEIENSRRIVVIATTNSPDEVDLQLRKPKRLENELEILIPTAGEREEIIKCILDSSNVKYNTKVLYKLSKWTPGFVGADLKLVILEALMAANKLGSTLSEDNLEKYFQDALTKVIPSALRGAIGFCTAKDTSFSQIGGLEEIKKILELSVKKQLENPKIFQKLGIPLTKGILLYGPPGCAKTTLVKALAKECNTTFLATSAADLYSPFVGDAEKKIVQLFTQARIGSPSILFIDEIDAVVGSKSGDREHGVQERILSTLLVEMDGVGLKVYSQKDNSLNCLGDKNSSRERISENEINNAVIVIGATNRPQLLDDALKRPGRFDRILYVPPPDKSERLRILKKLTENMPLHESVNLAELADLTNFYSGADLKNLCQESGLYALTSSKMTAESISWSHFEYVLKEYKPSLNEEIINFYESFKNFNV